MFALGAFINKAVDEDGLPLSKTPNTLSKHIGLQLKQSGFLAALPRLLAAVAAALTDTQHDPAWADVPQHLSELQGQTLPVLPDAAQQLTTLQDLSNWLLLVARESLFFFPQQLDKAAVAVPAMRLCAAALQLCSRCAAWYPADAAVPPGCIEQLLWNAWSTGQAVCSAWDLNVQGFDPPVAASPDVLRAVSMMLLVLTVCPHGFDQQRPELPDSRAARSNKAKVRRSARSTTSIAAWQFACTHESELPQVQQETLQALGCSGRAFMYVAGHILTPIVYGRTVLTICRALLWIARHNTAQTAASRSKLDQLGRTQLLELAEGLRSASREQPPSSSPMLPCASLFWLLPAVLLQWAGRQPASGPDFVEQHQVMMQLLHVCMGEVLGQYSYWAAADAALFQAAGGERVALEEQQAAMQSLQAGGSHWAPIVPSSMQGLSARDMLEANLERRLLQDAGSKAAEFSSSCMPPASCLEQLLLLASEAAARMLSRTQNSTGGASTPTVDGVSSSTAGSASSSRGTGRGTQGGGQPLVPGSDKCSSSAGELDRALFTLAQALPCLLKLSDVRLWHVLHKDAAAARYSPLKALQACDLTRSTSSGSDDDISVRQDSPAALCTALQQTLPQLTSLVEAALRRGVPREPCGSLAEIDRWVNRRPYGFLAQTGSIFLESITAAGVFVAAGVGQPGSPVLKPIASLTFTLLKVVNAINAQPDLGFVQASIHWGLECLQAVMCINSLILQAACSSTATGGSSSSSSLDALCKVLANRSEPGRSRDGHFSEDDLTAISSSTANTTSRRRSSSSISSSNALAIVPWLVSLGRALLGYSLVLRGCFGGKAGANPASQKAMDVHTAAMGSVFQEVAAVLPAWLQNGSVSAQLQAAGYVTAPVLELLQSATTAQQQMAQDGPTVLAQLLQRLGLALSNMPVGTACNNVPCGVLTGLSEHQLVVGSARRCSGCGVARYCDRSCQVIAWKQHKPACKAAAAAVKAAAAAATQPAVP